MRHNTILICLLGRLSELSAGHRVVNKGQRNCDNQPLNAFKNISYQHYSIMNTLDKSNFEILN